MELFRSGGQIREKESGFDYSPAPAQIAKPFAHDPP
jgi:hypothetical protein